MKDKEATAGFSGARKLLQSYIAVVVVSLLGEQLDPLSDTVSSFQSTTGSL
ncbi:hypothetical protein AM571_CH02042 [Rhizobium etli 8C-3]|uniref:Uncharacterized protein n=2 Tax=Rhizobium TaxID=379 RepID=A0A4R3RRJ8_9HYPH|nr:hypothetical protein AM571_CH02042 [Rhizobium etli 8C-3]TCU16765.1 hypothetical protein EV130_11718 [Rhizobium azibense]TCU34236.1 hypothetical protein EV129_113221 [Rhizobium azibense]